MKKQNRLLIVTALFATLIGLYIVPQFVRLATYSPDNYPFVQYSSGLKELVIVDFKDEEYPIISTKTDQKYTEQQGDSLLPIFNFYQLMSKGMQPDSIEGMEVNMQIIRANSVVYRHIPTSVNSNGEPLHTLFEAMPRRGGLKVPEDVFRLDNKIEFIDAQSNSVNEEKSKIFQELLDARDYNFPAQWNIGNPSARKAYDEGYFSLDAEGNLFHIKMVNSRPYVRNTKVSDSIEIAHFAIYEVPNKRFYGFVYSTSGEVYILEEGYKLLKLDLPIFDPENEQMLIMGNLLYWTISITNSESREFYALRTNDLVQVDNYTVQREPNTWDKAKELILPIYITFEDANNSLFFPRLHFGGMYSYMFSILLAVSYYFIVRRKSLFRTLLIALTGIAGLLASILLPPSRQNKTTK